ncbi:MAG: succinate dehydrogenase assembly factor 2 [Betaproteobacteria bacterium]|jgi:succinate dehydrogenase flavin-adding protein (antitoxin of CptAB toxin-antitoxin module)|nr:succinate dehydrogenase assembly factor 2 [Betaproteobacteria bacterium]
MERAEYERLRWRCIRRGLLELDLTLTKFLDNEFQKLSEPEVEAFKRLAELEDWDFLALIVGGQDVPDPHEAAVLAKLRKC